MPEELFYRLIASADGTEMDLSYATSDMTLEEELGRPAELTVLLIDAHHVLAHALQEGVALTLWLGTATNHPLVFRGVVYGLALKLSGGKTTLTLTAYDAMMRLGLRRRSRSLGGRRLGALTQMLAEANALRCPKVQLEADPLFPEEGLRQREETDLALLLRLAAAHGAVLWVRPEADSEVLELACRAALWRAEPAITLIYGRSGVKNRLLTFDAERWVAGQGRAPVLAGTRSADGEALREAVVAARGAGDEDPFFTEALARLHIDAPRLAEGVERLAAVAPTARANLEACLDTTELMDLPGLQDSEEAVRARAANLAYPRSQGMEATGRSWAGTPLSCAQLVNVLGVGGRFSGDWLVTRTRRTVSSGQSTFEFRCER